MGQSFRGMLKTELAEVRVEFRTLFHIDKGTGFTNRLFQRFLKDKDILLFTTHNDTKASIVERLNQKLKRKMWKYFTATNTIKYIDVL